MRTVHTASPVWRLLLRYFHAYRQVFFYAALFLAGIFAGALFLKTASPDTLEKLALLTGQFAKRRGEQQALSTFISSFTSTALMLAALFVCGFCAVAQPAILLLPIFRGLGFGYQAGYLYAQNGLGGVGYVALVVLPNMVFSTLILIYGCMEAFTMSSAYYRAAKQDSGRLINTRSYCAKFLLLLLLVLISSGLDALFTLLFSGLFTLA